MYSEYDSFANLQYKCRALQREVDEFKSGARYIKIQKEFDRANAANIRTITSLEKKLAESDKQVGIVRKYWFDSIDGLYEENNIALARELNIKDKDLAVMEKRAIKAETRNESLKIENDNQKKEIKRLQEELEREKNRADKLEARLKKDSKTSDKPPTSDMIFTKEKAESKKEKSDNTIGGQKGHPGHYLKPSETPDVIDKKSPPKVCPNCNGDIIIGKDFDKRQIIDIVFHVITTEQQVFGGVCSCCGHAMCENFTEEFAAPVSYGPALKTLVATLSNNSNVPINKIVELISYLSNGEINMSHGTVVNISKQLAEKLKSSTKEIANSLAVSDVLNLDETGVKVKGELTWMQIIANKYLTLFARSEKRGTLNKEMDTLINLFVGILIHDHLKSYYKYNGNKHGECNIHGLRYLEAITVILKHPWAKAMTELLLGANELKKELIDKGIHNMTEEQLSEIRSSYISILDQGQLEYNAAIEGKKHISYYTEERRLLKRLREYINQHLIFITDFNAPFGNNIAELGALYIKRKTKSSGGFRTNEGMDTYATIASVIHSLKKQHRGVFHEIKAAFLGSPPVFNTLIDVDTS